MARAKILVKYIIVKTTMVGVFAAVCNVALSNRSS